ncbi:MAG: PilW family protein [Candidatus Sericytochromatia bacterium]
MIRFFSPGERQKRLRFQRGLSLVELLISTALLMMIMVMGTTIFQNIRSHLKLAEEESRMQQYARDAMNQMAREVRQAAHLNWVYASGSTTHTFDIYFTKPHVNADGTTSGYDLVRYWYDDDYERPGTGLKSLYRAWKSNGAVTTADVTPFTNNRKRLIREVAAKNPGQDSFFKINSTADGKLSVLLNIQVTVYRFDHNVGLYVADNQRKFDISTELLLRNQS